MTIKTIEALPAFGRVELAMVSKEFLFVVVGNYHLDASQLLRTALTTRLLQVKRMVLGVRAKQMTLLVTSVNDSVQGMAARTCRQLGIEVRRAADLTAEQRVAIDLVMVMKLVPSEAIGEELTDQLEQQLETSVNPWEDNDKQFELVVPFNARQKNHKAVDLTRLDVPDPVNDKRLTYGPFVAVDQFLDKVTRESEPTHNRSEIPAYGPGIQPDGDKAGGLQNS